MPATRKSHKAELWKRLRDYRFDNLVPPQLIDQIRGAFGGTDPSTKAFASKLSRKLGWHVSFALRAIEEYKRFLYLGMVSDFYVTPPKTIDQVWHEHLLFTRAYRDFCRDVIGRDFDHAPELLPTDDQTDTFHAQYEATLVLYKTEFNSNPPYEIWGIAKYGRGRGPGATTAAPRRKERRTRDDDGSVFYDGLPLYSEVSDSDLHSHSGGGGFEGFGGGGEFSGSGSSGSFSGDSLGDVGSGVADGAGSGCSSGCGGGGCGGGGGD